MTTERLIKVEALTRVEGEGGLRVRLQGDVVEDVQLTIYEPPRFFEAFLKGRPLQDVPDITARICGICPVAYQMSSVHALEMALGVQVTPQIRQLRRLLYCGEWIESHALHMHLLHAPDFFKADGGIDLARRFPDEITRGLQLKKHGNALLDVIGGRAIHPVNVAVGGFYRLPKVSDMRALIPAFEWGLDAAIQATKWVAGFSFPDFERPYNMVALQHSEEYPMNEGAVASSSGLNVPVTDYEQYFEESHVAHSTALHSAFVSDSNAAEANAANANGSGGIYHVGPLARISLNRERLSENARQVADEIGFVTPCYNPFKAIIARGLELIHAYEESLQILRNYRPESEPRILFEPRAGEGMAATEAPRGLLYHRYQIDDLGQVTFAKIVPPTSQNQKQIEDDLKQMLPGVLHEDDQITTDACERLIRSYDPCISCSTHFLKLTLERR